VKVLIDRAAGTFLSSDLR